MTQYNTLNVKLSNSQLDKLKTGIKNGTEVTSLTNTQGFIKLLQIIHQLTLNYKRLNYLK